MEHARNRGFAHQRLDAYRVAVELARGVREPARTLEGGADLREQVTRSALAVARHVAEGASRHSPADRRQRFVVARGECAECDASLETAALLPNQDQGKLSALRVLVDRAGAMLTGLVRSESRRLEPGGT
jgi:four helix bundle protein